MEFFWDWPGFTPGLTARLTAGTGAQYYFGLVAQSPFTASMASVAANQAPVLPNGEPNAMQAPTSVAGEQPSALGAMPDPQIDLSRARFAHSSYDVLSDTVDELVAANQALMARVEALEAQVAALKDCTGCP